MFNAHVRRLANATMGSLVPATFLLMLRAAGLYFAIVFGIGFVLGTLRVLFLLPRFGTRWAELIEMPFMFIAIVLGARLTVRHFRLQTVPLVSIALGLISLCLVLVMEFSVVLWLRGMTFSDYLAERDPVSGTVYYLMLPLFAAMPWLMTRFDRSRLRQRKV
jgi:hypothetical protein